ncbi:MAG: hypothetical protein U0787_20980 [Polyangia bacterium]
MGQLLLAVTTVGGLNLNLVFVDPLVSPDRATPLPTVCLRSDCGA